MRTRQERVATDTWRSLVYRTTQLEHWSKRKPTVEPRWAKQQTKKLRPKPTKINSFMSGTSSSLTPDVGLKTLLHQSLSEPEFYGDLVYKFKKIEGRADFSDQFRKIIVRYKRIGYNINIMRQSACLVFNPITVNNFAFLFNCTPVARASDSMMAPT